MLHGPADARRVLERQDEYARSRAGRGAWVRSPSGSERPGRYSRRRVLLPVAERKPSALGVVALVALDNRGRLVRVELDAFWQAGRRAAPGDCGPVHACGPVAVQGAAGLLKRHEDVTFRSRGERVSVRQRDA
jgi:hypothetical protein